MCISTREKKMKNIWPILVVLYVKSRFVIIARGAQLDNGVDPPWIVSANITSKHPIAIFLVGTQIQAYKFTNSSYKERDVKSVSQSTKATNFSWTHKHRLSYHVKFEIAQNCQHQILDNKFQFYQHVELNSQEEI